MPRDCRLPEAMSEHPKPEKRQSDWPGEKHATKIRRNVGKSVANASNHKVLKRGCLLYKWRSPTFLGQVSLLNELIRNSNDCPRIRIICESRQKSDRSLAGLTNERKGS